MPFEAIGVFPKKNKEHILWLTKKYALFLCLFYGFVFFYSPKHQYSILK